MTLRRFVLLGLFATALLAGGALPSPAGAAKCIDCEGEEPGEEAEAQILTVQVQGRGSVATPTKTVCENTSGGLKTCELEVAEGKKVTLTAAALGEYVFGGWSGACSGSGSCEVTMTGPKSVTATFSNPPPAAPTITSPTSNQVFERTAEEPVTVSFTIGDPTVVSVSCSLDFVPVGACSAPSWTTPKLSAGKHTVQVTVKDAGGNVTTASRSFEVVIKAPPTEEGGTGDPGTVGGPGPSGGTTTTTPTLTETPPLQKIAARLVAKSKLDGDATVFRKLALKALPAGAKVLATCKGKGCPFKRKQPKVKAGTVDLSALFAGRELAAGALIEFKLSAPGMLGQTIDVKTRAGKAPKVTKH